MRGVITFEGIVEDGRIQLKAGVRLPEKTKVYVLVPDLQIEQAARISSPRLAHPEQAADFKLEIVGEAPDAGLSRGNPQAAGQMNDPIQCFLQRRR